MVGISTLKILHILNKKADGIDIDQVDTIIRDNIFPNYPEVASVGFVNTDGPAAFLYSLYLIEQKIVQKLDELQQLK